MVSPFIGVGADDDKVLINQLECVHSAPVATPGASYIAGKTKNKKVRTRGVNRMIQFNTIQFGSILL